jgi:competence protein ComEA
VLVYLRTSEPPAPPIETVSAAEASPTVVALVVHVAGEVASPGLYELPAGSRVRDAIEAAGGAREGADLDALNLAALISDGEKVYVARKGEPATAPDASTPPGKVNLNSATLSQLESLPGVGPVIAQRILDYRQRKGRFTSVRQLLEVEGIGEKKYASMKDQVTV